MVLFGEKNSMRKVLVGFDGSEGSEHALNRAITLVDEYGELILLAVIPSMDEKTFVDSEIYQRLKEKAKNVQWNNENRKEYYAIFAKSFKKKIKGENLYLFDLKDIENKIFKRK